MTSTSASASCSERRRWAGPAALAAGLALLAAAVPARGGVFYARDEALRLAFGDAAVTSRTVFLTEEHVAAVKARTGAPPESKLFTYHEGVRDGRVVGYAVIDTHVVRTLPETFLVVLTPEGEITRVVLLAFHEPPEYEPDSRWLAQFDHRRLDGAPWRIGRDIHGISGATLTAHAVREALLRILVMHELVMRPGR